jgi:HEAT repeat protein
VRIRPFPALVIVAAVGVLAAAGYQVATTGVRESAEGSTAIPEHESRAPRMIPQGEEDTNEGRGEGQAERQGDPEDIPPSFHRLPVDRLLELAVHSASAWTRADALEELAARRSNLSLPVLLDRLADPDGDVRRVAAAGLAESGNRTALAALERALPAETIERTRLAMAQAIAEVRPSGGTRAGE